MLTDIKRTMLRDLALMHQSQMPTSDSSTSPSRKDPTTSITINAVAARQIEVKREMCVIGRAERAGLPAPGCSAIRRPARKKAGKTHACPPSEAFSNSRRDIPCPVPHASREKHHFRLGYEKSGLEQHQNPNWLPDPQFWVLKSDTSYSGPPFTLGFKHVTAPTNIRSMIAALIPGVWAGNSLPLLLQSNTLTASSLTGFNFRV